MKTAAEENRKGIILRTPLATLLINLAWAYLVFFLCHIIFILYNLDVFRGQLDTSMIC